MMKPSRVFFFFNFAFSGKPSLKDEVYFVRGGAAGGRDFTNNGRHLVFNQELESRLKRREIVSFCSWHEK